MASILVVDDDEQIRKMLSEILETEGFLVKAVESGEKAISAARKQKFDVVLIDIQLPDMDGLELLERLKDIEVGPRMVKIVITGFPSIKSAIEAVDMDADGYIFKPIDVWKLLKTIRRRLDEKTKEYIRTYVKSR